LPVDGDWLNLTGFCAELERVLSHESTDCPSCVSLQRSFQSLLAQEDASLVRNYGSETLVHLLLVFNHYADWAVSVGVALGLADQDAQVADNWAIGLPSTNQYLRRLSREVSRCMTRLSIQLQKDHGYNPGAVYVEALMSDESPEQTRIRHQHASRGLKQIKGINDDNG
jgi:hypothetical protein